MELITSWDIPSLRKYVARCDNKDEGLPEVLGKGRKLIISKTHLRISFAGGSDLAVYYKSSCSSVVSTAIYIKQLTRSFDDLIRGQLFQNSKVHKGYSALCSVFI